MGCMCSKGVSTNEYAQKHQKKSVKSLTSSLRRDEVVTEVDNGATPRLISESNEENVTGSRRTLWDDEETKHVVSEKSDMRLDHRPRKIDIEGNGGMHQPVTSRIISIKYGDDGVQTAGLWPSWLIAVAGEAVKGWLPRRADSFEKMDKIKCYMQQLLCGLEHCHNHGVLHRDIKGSNLLIDNKGNLKIGDFGLATTFCSNHKQHLTSRVVTLWYRPPELLLGATDYGVGVDLWSAGCILAELFAGKPIMPGRTEVEQMHRIFKLCGSPSEEYWRKSKLPHATIFKPQHPYERCVAKTFKDFPPSALALLDSLLAVEPNNRGSTSSALKSEE